VLVSQAAIYECERTVQKDKFSSLDDAFWFTCVTVTTVGYGDISPETTAGRIVSIMTFVTGITLFGTFTAVMGSAFASVLREQIALRNSDNPDAPGDSVGNVDS